MKNIIIIVANTVDISDLATEEWYIKYTSASIVKKIENNKDIQEQGYLLIGIKDGSVL